MTGEPNVLLIDDDQSTADTFRLILRREGYAVRTARDAFDGLALIESTIPDAIVVDLRMPFVNGLGFLYRLRSRPECRDIPVAVVTGDYWLEADVLEAIADLGARVYFKPLGVDDLISVTRVLIGTTKH
jgi:two-component system CheB/CheR fusion protein